jgi:predicted transcriptional regulator
VKRLFGGSVKPLLVHFAQQQKFSAADLDELKALLKKKGK